jgi:hypothetical protein
MDRFGDCEVLWLVHLERRALFIDDGYNLEVQYIGPKGRQVIATPVRAWTLIAIRQQRRRRGSELICKRLPVLWTCDASVVSLLPRPHGRGY